MIERIQNNDRVWRIDEDKIKDVVTSYFRKIFTSLNLRSLDTILESINPCITLNMFALLQKALTKEEAIDSLSLTHSTKAPDPEAMPVLFFKNFQYIINQYVLHIILVILNNNIDPSSINATHIVLISKVHNSNCIKDYRPINLYNVIFELMTETIANMLKKIFLNIIHCTQSGFIPSRLITNKVLVAFKTFYFLKN